jgi:Glycosyl transferase family 2
VTGAIAISSRPDEMPFPFSAFSAVRSASEHRGVHLVYIEQLPYGYWWDRLRPTIELAYGSVPEHFEQFDDMRVWLAGGGSVAPHESGFDDALQRYYDDPRAADANTAAEHELSAAAQTLAKVQGELQEAEGRRRARPEPSPPVGHCRLGIVTATFDDFTGVWATIGSIVMHHPEVSDQISFTIVDNHPDGVASPALKALEHKVPRLRYIPFSGYRSTAVRDLACREADADIVMCLDSHVMLAPGALAALLRYYDEHPDSLDLLHGPLLDERAGVIATQFDPGWGEGMYGRWGLDERGCDPTAPPFEIQMMGLGMFACRRDAWVGINPRFRGFGGEEGYLHEKFRRAGGRVLCHPALGWQHRFDRPEGIPYENLYEDRIRNHLLGFRELGWDVAPLAAHFRELLGERDSAALLGQTQRQLVSPFDHFDTVICLNLDRETNRWREMQRRFEALDIAWRVERFPAREVRANRRAGHVQSFQAVIEHARLRDYRNLLLIEDDAIFLDSTLDVMRAAVADLAGREWDLLFLGGAVWGEHFPFAKHSLTLQVPDRITTTHALAINASAFEPLLAGLPTSTDLLELTGWLAKNHGTDQYLSSVIERRELRALSVWPRVATQPELLEYTDADRQLRDRYTI